METLSRKQEKLIQSLKQKKYRDENGLFVLEGHKLIEEAIKSNVQMQYLLLDETVEESYNLPIDCLTVSPERMKKLSSLKKAPGILGVAKKIELEELEWQKNELILLLDDIRDPGNLGTILRNAAAFGVKLIVCSTSTVDCYNPKVVQASMGALFWVNILYTDLEEWLDRNGSKCTSYAADIEGKSIYECKWNFPAVVILGSESHGITNSLMKKANHSIQIPMQEETESLNVSSASAIFLSEISRMFR